MPKSDILNGVLPELLFNKFLRVLCITKRLRVEKETSLERDNVLQLASSQSFPRGDNLRAIK